jgi:hypothetical protein
MSSQENLWFSNLFTVSVSEQIELDICLFVCLFFALSVPDEGYSRNTSWALTLISTLLSYIFMYVNVVYNLSNDWFFIGYYFIKLLQHLRVDPVIPFNNSQDVILQRVWVYNKLLPHFIEVLVSCQESERLCLC